MLINGILANQIALEEDRRILARFDGRYCEMCDQILESASELEAHGDLCKIQKTHET